MSWLGRFQLGATAPLYLVTTDANDLPAVPDKPPQYKVFNGTTLVEQGLLPVNDKYVITGWFRRPLFLGRLYATGQYQVVYYWRVSSAYGVDSDNFEILPNGDNRGAGIGAYFFERPEGSYVVQGLESGQIIKGRNPTI